MSTLSTLPRAVVQCVEPQVVGIPQGLSPHPQSLEQPCRTIVKKVKHILCAANSIHVAISSGIPATEVAPTNRRVPLLSWTLPHTRGTHPQLATPGATKPATTILQSHLIAFTRPLQPHFINLPTIYGYDWRTRGIFSLSDVRIVDLSSARVCEKNPVTFVRTQKFLNLVFPE